MGRYIPAAERGWIDVGITRVSIIWHIARYAERARERGRLSFRFHKIAFEGSRAARIFLRFDGVGTRSARRTVSLPIPVTLTLTMKRTCCSGADGESMWETRYPVVNVLRAPSALPDYILIEPAYAPRSVVRGRPIVTLWGPDGFFG